MSTTTAATNYRIRFVYDEDAVFEECNGEARPLTREEYDKDYYVENGKRASYERYRAYWGNPDRHVYLGAIVDRQCPCCDTWKTAASLWYIDVMDDQPEAQCVDRTYTREELEAIPGYLRDVARELFDEARS